MVKDPIELWFDFSSGYAYFAAFAIDPVAEKHSRSVLWRPYMLGVAFKQTGARGASEARSNSAKRACQGCQPAGIAQ